ncbi:RNA polymerase sigma factor region1.1 domain-containing protein [Methylorubrum extorquens]
MAGTIDRGTLDRLIALGRERGELTVEEFQAALPVSSMDVDALVLVMLELEAAGISVEPEVFRPQAHRPVPLTPELPTPVGDVSPMIARTAEDSPTTARSAAKVAEAPAASGASGERTGIDQIVLLSGLAAFLILGVVLVLI